MSYIDRESIKENNSANKDFDNWAEEELSEYARQHGIDLDDALSQKDIVNRIRAFEQQRTNSV